MPSTSIFLDQVHSEWAPIIERALHTLSDDYRQNLLTTNDWTPGKHKVFAAFSEPLSAVRTLLIGESPYPRMESANGYAFWDANVQDLWSETGLSKAVNRATSLRNLMKMLLFARGDLGDDFSQPAIAAVDKSKFHQRASSFFNGLMANGFLLLNATPVYRANEIKYHAKLWQAFMLTILDALLEYNPSISLILLGRIALRVPGCDRFECLIAEHPYNVSFITNPRVVEFFKPLDLLIDHEKTNHG